MTRPDINELLGSGKARGPNGRRPRSRAQQRNRSLAALLVVVVILAGTGAAVVVGGRRVIDGLTGGPDDFAGNGTTSVTVVIPKGATAVRIGDVLEAAGVVNSSEAFTAAARKDERYRSIQPGSYSLKLRMSGTSALQLLLDPKSRLKGALTIPEGFTLKQILATTAAKTKIPLAELEAAAAKPASIGLPKYAEGRVEGFLYPATYEVLPGTSATAVLTMMVKRFEQEATDLELVERAAQVHLTPLEAVIVGSMIERETKFGEERPKIARVIYNRLKRDQALQIDATIQYLLPKQKAHLLNTDLQVQSPYNTYLHKGLPPGPISSPGSASLDAALAPAKGPWRWYVGTDKAGHHEFTDNEAEFLELKAKGKAATAP